MFFANKICDIRKSVLTLQRIPIGIAPKIQKLTLIDKNMSKNKNKKQRLSLLKCAKTLSMALDAPVTMCGKKSEQTFTRKQRCEIYSLLDIVVKSAQVAQRECLKDAPDRRILHNLVRGNLSEITNRLSKVIDQGDDRVFYIGDARFEVTE